MFIGHPEAGEKSAIVYTLPSCCRIHAIDPQHYLIDALEKLVAADGQPSEAMLDSLLPQNWAKAHPEALIKEPK